MPHVHNSQITRAAETAETGNSDSVDSGGGSGLGGAGRAGPLALSAVGGRRFLLTLVSGAGTFLLCWQGKISDDVYSVVTIATVAAYITGNVAQKLKAPGGPD